jgi:hypothetical protein
MLFHSKKEFKKKYILPFKQFSESKFNFNVRGSCRRIADVALRYDFTQLLVVKWVENPQKSYFSMNFIFRDN